MKSFVKGPIVAVALSVLFILVLLNNYFFPYMDRQKEFAMMSKAMELEDSIESNKRKREEKEFKELCVDIKKFDDCSRMIKLTESLRFLKKNRLAIREIGEYPEVTSIRYLIRPLKRNALEKTLVFFKVSGMSFLYKTDKFNVVRKNKSDDTLSAEGYGNYLIIGGYHNSDFANVFKQAKEFAKYHSFGCAQVEVPGFGNLYELQVFENGKKISASFRGDYGLSINKQEFELLMSNKIPASILEPLKLNNTCFVRKPEELNRFDFYYEDFEGILRRYRTLTIVKDAEMCRTLRIGF